MRSRSTSDGDQRQREQQQQREQTRPERERDNERTAKSQTGRVRIPKIQYRFLKKLDEEGVGGELRTGALNMVDKIKQFPLDAQHVMGSWERFTKRAIDDFKAQRGNDAERDRIHAAYAVVFSALKDGQPAKSKGELKQRIDVYAANHRERGVGSVPAAGASRKEVMKDEARAREEQQRQEQVQRQPSLLDRAPPRIEQHLDTAITTVRGLSPQLRASIEGSAREMILEGHYTQRTAKEAMPDAVRDFQADKSERNTVHMLTLAVIAKAPEHKALLNDLWDMPRDQMKELEAEGRARLERYPPLETGLADLRKDAVDAAIRVGVSTTPATQREALVLAHAREELECMADPTRMQWQNVSSELARDLT